MCCIFYARVYQLQICSSAYDAAVSTPAVCCGNLDSLKNPQSRFQNWIEIGQIHLRLGIRACHQYIEIGLWCNACLIVRHSYPRNQESQIQSCPWAVMIIFASLLRPLLAITQAVPPPTIPLSSVVLAHCNKGFVIAFVFWVAMYMYWQSCYYNASLHTGVVQQLTMLQIYLGHRWSWQGSLLNAFFGAYISTYAMMMTSSHRKTSAWEYMAYTTPESAYNIIYIYADSGVVYTFELLKCCMPESNCMRLRGVYSCPSSRLASFTNMQSQWHSSVILLVQSTLMGYFLLLHSFRSSLHDVNTQTAHTVVFFTVVGFLAAFVSSLEMVASRMLLRFLQYWCWQSRALQSGMPSSGSSSLA